MFASSPPAATMLFAEAARQRVENFVGSEEERVLDLVSKTSRALCVPTMVWVSVWATPRGWPSVVDLEPVKVEAGMEMVRRVSSQPMLETVVEVEVRPET